MWNCSFAEEPVDLKLLCLRMMKKAGIVIAVTVFGALLAGGIFYLKEIVFSPNEAYLATGETYIDYIPEDAYGIARVYITEEAWASLVKSDDFVEFISNEISDKGYSVPDTLIRDSVSASLLSDSRIVTTFTRAADPQLAAAIGAALQNAIMDFCAGRDEIAGTFPVTAPKEAERKVWADGMVKIAVVGAVSGFFLSVTICLFTCILDDSVYLPVTVEKRYGIPVAGTLQSAELAVNLKKLCGNSQKLGMAGVTTDPDEAAGMKASMEGALQEAVKPVGTQLFWTGCVAFDEKWLAQVKGADGVILAVKGGKRDGRYIDRVLNFLHKQEIPVKGAILFAADEKLIARYYRPGILAKGKKA